MTLDKVPGPRGDEQHHAGFHYHTPPGETGVQARGDVGPHALSDDEAVRADNVVSVTEERVAPKQVCADDPQTSCE